MKPERILLLFLLLIPAFGAQAQKEANIWYLGNHRTLDFNVQPPVVRQGGPDGWRSGIVATHSDSEGKLLLSSDGLKVWNRNNELLGQLQELEFYQGEVQMVPHPGDTKILYVFYKSPTAHSYWGIYYSTVDLDGNNGKGSILTKHQLLHTDGHGGFSITRNGTSSTYWLVTDRNDNVTPVGTDRIYAYKIDVTGVKPTPVISSPLPIGFANDYKLSPQGNKLAFSRGHEPGLGFADFDLETGEVSNMLLIDYRYYYVEFSPSADVLYAVRDSSVYQFSLCSDNEVTMFYTKKLISSQGPILGRPQLAPDGKIYIPQIGTENYAVIHQPNRLGQACDLRLADLLIGKLVHERLPQFLTNYFYKAHAGPMVEADAGEDKVVCAGEGVKLGKTNNSTLTYHWSPSLYLDDTLAALPVFRYTERAITSIRKFKFVLSVTGEFCSMIDTVEVTVQPLPEQPLITGSPSVCPGVEEVTYQTEGKEGLQYQWLVAGGTVVAGNGTSSIKVNWGASNPAARVELLVKNAYGCASSKAVLPVRVNPLLQTDKPFGDTAVCVNDNVKSYQIPFTNGSVYTWESRGGEIIAGQGTSIATVRWGGMGLQQVWVQEKSITRDTICFGTSDPLMVRVFRDSAAIAVQFVTINEQQMQDVDLRWEYRNFPRLAPSLQVQRREEGANAWVTVKEMPVTVTSFSDPRLPTHEKYFGYMVQGRNQCGEIIQSPVHNTVLLEGTSDPRAEEITLQWNRYLGWEQGVKHYELWRRLDNEDTYRMVQIIPRDELNYRAISGKNGFVHRFRIMAVAAGSAYASWSNEVIIKFEHALTIPNVFTPNRDGYNDFFFIPKLELYPENELVVFNRWGKEIYRRRGYQGEWDGSGHAPGPYYYLLSLSRGNLKLKGWVEIIH